MDTNYAVLAISTISGEKSKKMSNEEIISLIIEVLKSDINTDEITFDESQNATIKPSKEPMVLFLHKVEILNQSFESKNTGVKFAKEYVRTILKLAKDTHEDVKVIEDLKLFLKMLNDRNSSNIKHIIMKILRSFNVLRLFLITILCLFSCTGNNSDKERIAEFESNNNPNEDVISSSSQTTEDLSESRNILDYVGQYEFTDALGLSFVLTINEDETIQITQKGTNTTYYCSCDHNDLRGYSTIRIYFEIEPHITFPSGDEPYINPMAIPVGAKYIYRTDDALQAKNPHNRLDLNKIN